MATITVKVLFFGEAAQLMKKREDRLELCENIVYEDLSHLIFQKFPQLEKVRSTTILAVDQQYCDPGQQLVLTSVSEIAVIPPLSGG